MNDWVINELAENELQELVKLVGLTKACEIVEGMLPENEFDRAFYSAMLTKIKEWKDEE